MKFTLSWLRDHLDTDADLPAITARLTAIGLEVEGVEDPAARYADFYVAHVRDAAPHPNADALRLLTVDAGPSVNGGQPLTIVCGASNARAGMTGVLGIVGATVPASCMVLGPAVIRGVPSEGMMCSTRELGLGDEHDGILELTPDAAPGTAFAVWAGLDDPVIDVSVTPNRQDCMGVRGIARDLAASGLGTLRPLALASVPDVPDGFAGDTRIAIADHDGCPAFWGRNITGIRNGPAPAIIARRLTAIGQRSISAVVDITNYVMFDLGRPSHAYDRARLTGGLTARKALPGESVEALNGRTYALAPDMTVIADAARVHDIAGIMGGMDSGVEPDTTDIVLEVAWFDPAGIARTGQALSLTSDARQRFERGVDPAALDIAMDHLTAMILAHCGGVPGPVHRIGAPPRVTRPIAYDPARAATLGGVDVPADEQAATLAALGCSVARDAVDRWIVTPPSWRRDMHGPADVVEEVVRIAGFDRIAPVALPRPEGVARPTATPAQGRERRVRRTAAALGLNEAITWSFLSRRDADLWGGGDWTLANPLSEELAVMRPSLLPGLLAAAARNRARGAERIALFEVGRRYTADTASAGSAEPLDLALVLTGEARPRDWATGKAQGFTPHDARAFAEALLAAAGAPVDKLMVMDADDTLGVWHPAQAATLRLGPRTILARYGTLHPRAGAAMGLDQPVMAAVLHLDAIPARGGRGSGLARPAFAPPALQPVKRDFAFIVPATLAAEALVRAVRGADKAAITAARLFDRFAGPGMAEGMVSMAIEVTLQPAERSFTDAELVVISDRIVAAAAKLGAELRR